MKRSFIHLLPILFIGFFVSPLTSQEVTLSGYIKDASNGETLIGATVYLTELDLGNVSNVYGFYSLSIPPGTYNAKFEYLGYATVTKQIELPANTELDIELSEESTALAEVVVIATSNDENVSRLDMSVSKLDAKTIKKMPSLLGEAEVIRSIQLLPGVSSVGEGAAGFNVRGGSIDQNLILLDEAPVYNSSHLLGFYSVFNPDAVSEVQLKKGGIPARYGGRLSSILDVRMKEGDSKKMVLNGGLGFIFSRLSVEAPIIKDKSSFVLAARRSYIDILSKPFLDEDFAGSQLNFYDLTLKTNYKFSNKDRLFLSSYIGRDVFGVDEDTGFNWGNVTTTLRWNHLFSDKVFSNFTLYYSDFDYELESSGVDGIGTFRWDAGILNGSAKLELSAYLNPQNLIKFGGQTILYKFEPGNAIINDSGGDSERVIHPKYGMESSLFLENEQAIGDKIKLNYGLRFSHFVFTGEGPAYTFGEAPKGFRKPLINSTFYERWEVIESFHNLEPRFAVKYQVNETNAIKASYNRTVQYLQLLSNTTASTPVDVWTPATNNIDPLKADQVALGYFQNFKDNEYEFSTEVYYKAIQNVFDYINGANVVLNELVEASLLSGKGRAYGAEFLLKKNKGKLTGWLSYTLARSESLVEGINDFDWYPTRFDQTHNLSLVGFYEINNRWSLSANFSYATGTPSNFPTSRFEQQGYIVPHNANNSRNNVRIPSYHRLDIGATRKGKIDPNKRWNHEWNFSIYNVYSRKNPFTITFRQSDNRQIVGKPLATQAYNLSVIGFLIPSVTYNFNFK